MTTKHEPTPRPETSNPVGNPFVGEVIISQGDDDGRVSLAPLDPVTALRGLLATPPLRRDDQD